MIAFFVTAGIYPFITFVTGGYNRAGTTLIAASITFSITVLMGVPLFIYFRYKGWLGWWRMALGGFGIGIFCSLIALPAGFDVFLFTCGVFGFVGILHALMFWVIGVWRNSDPALHPSCERGIGP